MVPQIYLIMFITFKYEFAEHWCVKMKFEYQTAHEWYIHIAAVQLIRRVEKGA